MQRSSVQVPPELRDMTEVKTFVRPMTREQFDAAIIALGGREMFARPRRYGIWTRTGDVCVYAPVSGPQLPPALEDMRH